MPGTFDEIIKQQMRGSQRGLGYQDARDRAARQINMRDRGINSTAMPPPMMAQPNGQFPPAPGSNVDAMIAAQMPDEMQVPGAAQVVAATPPTEMGDASAAELAQADPAFQTALAQSIAEQAGVDTAAAPVPNTVRPVAPGAPAQLPQSQEAFDPTSLIATVAALGGTGVVASLLHRYRLGDPDAAETFRANGISPDELEMFARDIMPQRERGTQQAPKSNNQKPPRRNQSAKKPATQSKDEKNSTADDGKKIPATGRDRFGNKNKSQPGKTSGIRPAVKIRPKVKF